MTRVEGWWPIDAQESKVDGTQGAAGLSRGWQVMELISFASTWCKVRVTERVSFVGVMAGDICDFKRPTGWPLKPLGMLFRGIALWLGMSRDAITSLKGDGSAVLSATAFDKPLKGKSAVLVALVSERGAAASSFCGLITKER